jgi:predicted DNA-binding transcriptional regulator AlpA
MNDASRDKLTISVNEMAAVLGIGRNAAYDLTHRRDFYPAIRISPRRVVVSRSGLQKWLAEQTGEGGNGEKQNLSKT